MDRLVTIDDRYCGPSDRGNGGYTCALLARFLHGPAEVTLRLPSPLGRPLQVCSEPNDRVTLRDGDLVIAEGAPIGSLEVDIPPLVNLEQAHSAERRSDRLDPDPPFARCFSCGPERSADDGLRIFAGPVDGRDVHAATWTPRAEFADENGDVELEILWAAIDCSARAPLVGSGWAASVLGRMALQQLMPVPVERQYVVMSWRLGIEGRRGLCADALYDENGVVYATARSTWIKPRE